MEYDVTIHTHTHNFLSFEWANELAQQFLTVFIGLRMSQSNSKGCSNYLAFILNLLPSDPRKSQMTNTFPEHSKFLPQQFHQSETQHAQCSASVTGIGYDNHHMACKGWADFNFILCHQVQCPKFTKPVKLPVCLLNTRSFLILISSVTKNC